MRGLRWLLVVSMVVGLSVPGWAGDQGRCKNELDPTCKERFENLCPDEKHELCRPQSHKLCKTERRRSVVDMTFRNLGQETFMGPVCLVLEDFNPLRYDISFGRAITGVSDSKANDLSSLQAALKITIPTASAAAGTEKTTTSSEASKPAQAAMDPSAARTNALKSIEADADPSVTYEIKQDLKADDIEALLDLEGIELGIQDLSEGEANEAGLQLTDRRKPIDDNNVYFVPTPDTTPDLESIRAYLQTYRVPAKPSITPRDLGFDENDLGRDFLDQPIVSLNQRQGQTEIEVRTQEAPRTTSNHPEIERAVSDLETDLAILKRQIDNVSSAVLEIRGVLTMAGKRLRSIVTASDAVLRDKGCQELSDRLDDLDLDLERALLTARASWPNSSDLQALATSPKQLTERRLELLEEEEDLGAWRKEGTNDKRWDRLKKNIEDASGTAAALTADSNALKALQELCDELSLWRELIASFDPNSCTKEIPVECGFPAFGQKTYEFTVFSLDRIDDEAKLADAKFIEVVCPARIAVTGGVGYSALDEKSYDIVFSAPDPPQAMMDDPPDMEDMEEQPLEAVRRFQRTRESNQEVGLTLALHARLTNFLIYDLPAGIHLTVGTFFDLEGGEASDTLGYLVGGSLSLGDHAFITAGVLFARQDELGGGFELGDIAPPNVGDTPPLTREWNDALFGAITYRIGGSP